MRNSTHGSGISFSGWLARISIVDELLQELNRAEVRYLLIGGQAIRLHGLPRFSMDWDLFVPPRDTHNFDKVNATLAAELDLPLTPLGPRGEGFVQTYQTSKGILQFHLAVPGLPAFEAAWERRQERITETGIRVPCLSATDLLAAKEAANRPEDQTDLRFLRELRAQGLL